MLPRPLLVGLTVFALGRAAAADLAISVTQTPQGTPVPDAVISLIPLDPTAPSTAPAAPVEIVQRNKEFEPEVTVIAKGTTVTFTNRETKGQHHVYSLSDVKKFEIPLHKPGSGGSVQFDTPGVAVVGCNVHEWMRAYIVVVATAWFAKTGADGGATIAAPAGRYRAEIWHARSKSAETREITLPASAPLTFALTLEPGSGRIHRGPEATGGGYK